MDEEEEMDACSCFTVVMVDASVLDLAIEVNVVAVSSSI